MELPIVFVLFLSTSLAVSYAGPIANELYTIQAREAPSLTVAEQMRSSTNEGILLGDMVIDPHRNAIKDKSLRWPKGIVYYVIANELAGAIEKNIVSAMREIESDVNAQNGDCIQFKPRTTQTDYINIHAGDGCHAIVGYTGNGPQEVSIGKGCELKGIIMHELLHALGFFHEQNRYDRDTYVSVDLHNVPTKNKADFTKMTKFQIDTLGVTYSYDSIMHYGPYQMAADQSRPVLTPKNGQFTGQKMGQRLQLVPTDVLKIQKLYQCQEDTSHITSIQKESFARCNFESDLCTLTQGSGDFNWQSTKSPSAAGPVAGNTNGADGYLLATASGHNGKVASFATPKMSKGAICLDFFIFQKGPTSHLDLVAIGDLIQTQTFATYKGQNRNMWYNYRIDLNVPDGITFQVVFEAHMYSGDVAIDDLNVYPGQCL